MAYFSVPCSKAMLIQSETAPMPKLVLSTYQTDYVSPADRRREQALLAIAAMPPDYLDESAGKRILPTTFKEVYQNCVSASIGDRLELQFNDDTPEWKKQNRKAAAEHWLRPLEERRRFAETRKSNGRGGGDAGGSGGGGGVGGSGGEMGETGCGMDGSDGLMYESATPGDQGEICGVVDGYIMDIPDNSLPNGCEGDAGGYPCQ